MAADRPQTTFPEVSDDALREAAAQGGAAFAECVAGAISAFIGGELTADNIGRLNAQQITLMAYMTVRREVMQGGFIQMIYNGYGPFIFENPFAKAMRLWGLRDLTNIIYDARRLYEKTRDDICRELTDDEFMALYEQHEEYDALDDDFVEREAEFTDEVARYVDGNIADFVGVKG